MKINFLRNSILTLFLLFSVMAAAQDLGSETVVVVKPYSPSVDDANKIRETPTIADSLGMEKKVVQYSIISVPVASTFAPAKGRAANVERQRPPKVYDNYITLGFGSYTSVLAEFYSNIEISRSDNFGIFLNHNSSQGGIEVVTFDHHYYDTELNLNYASRQRNLVWNTDFGVEHLLYNWYGVSPWVVQNGLPENNMDSFTPEHNYYSVRAGGEIVLDDSFFDRAEANYRYFGDDYNSVEHRFQLRPNLEIPIGGELFNTTFVLDYLSTSFEEPPITSANGDFSFLNLGVESGLLVLRDDLTLDLGAGLYYSYDTNNGESNIYVYPQVTASYALAGEYFIAYAGLEGELRQNSYYEFVQENPFLSPSQTIHPTDRQYNGYVGAKGKLSGSVGYNIRASYMAEDYKPLMVSTPWVADSDREDYQYDNSFRVVYDQVKTLSAFGELVFDLSRDFTMRTNAEFFTYDTKEQGEAWNLPNYKASVMADYQISKNWFAGAHIFLVGERKDYVPTFSVIPERTEITTLDSYVDLNANLGYRFNDRLSIFAKGHNLLGENYEKWMDYPVLGLQLMGGATYKFDFGR